jgi:hypothetical protein
MIFMMLFALVWAAIELFNQLSYSVFELPELFPARFSFEQCWGERFTR